MKQKIIGRVERIDLVDLDLCDLKCKIDTGAYTGALHVDFIEQINENIRFKTFNKTYTLPIHKQKLVKSSNGKKELRFYIKTHANFLGKKYKIVLSLTNRGSMKNPVLIGRKFLNERFLVDVSKTYTYLKEERWEFMYYQEIQNYTQQKD